ncbi:ATP-binding protein [Fodinicurvata sp. EGI_FJ10296]|jgi:K+-sensing histidine kinase KdpD|uniref:ATP-binding protein n=1 Tax=Fodinicurvata sp. EGI_FJ10296 TaxID=3231908 RepID=UPI003456157D
MAEYTLESLVGTILDLSQADLSLQDGGTGGGSAITDVASVASTVLAERRDSLGDTGIVIVDRIDHDFPSVAVCPTAVRQMIRHLLGIAVGSCERGNTVVLTSSRDDELVKISVLDDGRAFGAEDIPDDLYNALDAVVLRAGDVSASEDRARVVVTPMGLTLAVIHALLVRQGGMLEVANGPAGGKQVTLAFPLDDSAAASENAAEIEMAD